MSKVSMLGFRVHAGSRARIRLSAPTAAMKKKDDSGDT